MRLNGRRAAVCGARLKLTYARVVTTTNEVLAVLIGAFFVCGGTWYVVSPRKALESNYAWDRRWTRIFTFGTIDPKPRRVTDRAVRLAVALGVIMALLGVAVLFGGLRAFV